MKIKMKFLILILFSLIYFSSCIKSKGDNEITLFVGIDVSGSFTLRSDYKDALKFTAYYIYAHLNNLDGLKKPKTLFVGSIGGFGEGEAKVFFPIHEFQGKTKDQIEAKLHEIFSTQKDKITDFNTYFDSIANVVKKQNLRLKPISILIVTDGNPEKRENGKVGPMPFNEINVTPLEFLARNITVRLIYPNAVTSSKWDKEVKRKRVRIWTKEAEVMKGWKEMLMQNESIENQHKLWNWINDNVDFKIKSNTVF